jgi:predicted O-methyltransferase YrrM
MRVGHVRSFVMAGVLLAAAAQPMFGQSAPAAPDVDKRVQTFLASRRGTWRDLNVPEVDGRTLHDLVVTRGFRRAVEIGTSTGHSGVWIAWALAKTGGRLITIELDDRRRQQALANFREAGLAQYVDARLGDAHEIVPTLEGPIDFVFSDADKDWYTRYFTALWPKMAPGGCFTAHNVTMRGPGIREFLDHLKTVKDGETTIDTKSSAGISMTCKAR